MFLLLLVLPVDLNAKQQGLAAVLGLVVTWWITEAIPIPVAGIVGLCLCVILNVASADEVFGSVGAATSPFMSNTGAAAMMLVITYGITVGGLLLPIGSPPNLIGRGLLEEATGQRITFFEWFLTALPIVVVMFVALILVILFLNRPEWTGSRGRASTSPGRSASSGR